MNRATLKCGHCKRQLSSAKSLRKHLEYRERHGCCPNHGPSVKAYFRDYQRAIKNEDEPWSMLEDVEHFT